MQFAVAVSQVGRCSRRKRIAHPCHTSSESRVGEELFASRVVDAFDVLGEKFPSIKSDASDVEVAGGVHFCSYIVQLPSAFSWVKEIDAQPRHNRMVIAVFFPLENKRIEVVILEIHHGEK